MAVPDLQDALDHLQRKDVDAAIATLERKVEELPAHLTAHVLLARAYESKHQWEKALQYWENVYFLIPNSPVARTGKQRVLRQLNQDEGADGLEAAAPSPSAPAPTDPAPTETQPSRDPESDEAPTTATEAVSELDELRRQAENEARQGGARPELVNTPEGRAADPPGETPADRVGEMEKDDEDLDRLIDELESARIDPDPDVDDVPEPDLENDVDDLVSETLARIHEAQNQYRKAAQIYVKLASQEPDQSRAYLEKAAEMRQQAEQNAKDEPTR
jgi:tetratricopeptide (TPR) repeat protein